MNRQAAFFYDKYHFNEAGAREVARLAAAGFSQSVGYASSK
jgi:hypothetical protein